MDTQAGNIPPNYQPLQGSDRQPAPNARRIGPADPNETLNITISLRRRPDGPPLPDADHITGTPAISRPNLSAAEYTARYGADPADITRVVAFVEKMGLKVEETHADQRTIIVSGTVTQMSAAFAVQLGCYEQAAVSGQEAESGTYRGREGSIYIPGDLTGIIVGVFGLDNRRMARRH
ncbi:MAG TPA: protease pro-enzyme activation domain-containing protein [Puia sp.]|jgi:kumamolisin|nr:protease pro-enzyme activation domain-containing protein [Puia sp.]